MERTGDDFGTLDRSLKQIRVLTIHHRPDLESAGSPHSIICSLETVGLNDAHPFHALSYVWGPSTAHTPILVNGRTTLIRKNLWTFLSALKARFCSDSDRTLRLWADSICIRQDDLGERNYQVSMMGEIYEAADAVYAWLGDSSSSSDAGMKYVEGIAKMRAENRPWVQLSRSPESGLRNIVLSPYWTRLWIKQEVILAKDVWFFYGPDVVNWKDLRFAANLKHERRRHHRPMRRMGRLIEDPTNVPLDLRQQAMISVLNLRSLPHQNVGLPELVTTFRTAQCKDPRDRIYALLSLVEQDVKQQIVVDYEKSLLQVLLENYRLWTGESINEMILGEENKSVPIYTLRYFCSSIARLMPGHEFTRLYYSDLIRQDITAQGIFTTSTPSEITSMRTIAVIGDTLLPVHQGEDEKIKAYGYISLVLVRTRTASGQSINRREYYVYSDSMPAEADLVAHLGSRLCFFRKSRFTGGNTEGELELLTTGSEILPVSPTGANHKSLSMQLLQHPYHWVNRQLTDARFEIVYDKSKSALKQKPLGGGVSILCNSAAIIMLLAESKMLELHESKMDSKRSLSILYGAELSKGWSPYTFGIEHGLLGPCDACQKLSNGYPSTSWQQQPESDEVACWCEWKPSLAYKPRVRFRGFSRVDSMPVYVDR